LALITIDRGHTPDGSSLMHAIPMFAVAAWAVLAVQLAAPNSIQPLESETIVPAPINAVWDAWTTRRHLEVWQVARASDVELRIGGRWRTSYSKESNLNDNTTIESEVLAFDPGRMLAVRTVRTPSDLPFAKAILETWSVLYLEPLDEARTRVVVRMFGFTGSSESQKMRAFFERGNPYELRKLADYFGSARATR
jgi:uncharacterized protein YndB with AHSA1/START domain